MTDLAAETRPCDSCVRPSLKYRLTSKLEKLGQYSEDAKLKDEANKKLLKAIEAGISGSMVAKPVQRDAA